MDDIPKEMHLKHHDWMESCIPLLTDYLQERKESRDRWEKYRTSFFGAIFSAVGIAVVSVLAWIGKLVLKALEGGGS